MYNIGILCLDEYKPNHWTIWNEPSETPFEWIIFGDFLAVQEENLIWTLYLLERKMEPRFLFTDLTKEKLIDLTEML